MKKAIETSVQALKATGSEHGFQKKIERYQLANANADYSMDQRLTRAAKVLAAIKKLEGRFAEAKIVPLSDYTFLAELFGKHLAGLEEKSFTTEATRAIQRDLDQGESNGNKVTKEQRAVVMEYHTNAQRKNWDKVREIRIVLTHKGLLKGKDAEDLKKVEAKIAAEEKKQQPTGLPTREQVGKKLAEVA